MLKVLEAIEQVANSSTDLDVGFDYLFGFMAENQLAETSCGFAHYHLVEKDGPLTPGGKPSFLYLVGKEFKEEDWVAFDDRQAFRDYVQRRESERGGSF